MGHQWRNSISHLCILRSFQLAPVAAGCSFSLENKAIVKGLQSRHFTNGQRMLVYFEGNFYSLLEAYERGIITKENVAAIEWDKTLQ